ncbi:MAG: DNA polymerase III subunit delta [Blastopirellula sp.]|nr:MAG: DNA polymerase III subunit delta [Blastopirellula sp.]
MSNTLHAFEFAQLKTPEIPGVCVLFGQESFLHRSTLEVLCQHLLGDDEDVPFTRLEGKTAQWRDVIDEVGTMSLFGSGGRRLVVVDNADEFVSKHRDQLERYFEKPKSSGVLVLQVEKWLKTTRLYKRADKTGLQVDCNAPQKKAGKRNTLDKKALCDWMSDRAKSTHEFVLPVSSANALIDLIGPELGLIDQELARLALYVDPGAKVTDSLVREVVGGWQMKAIWDLVDIALVGNTKEALEHLDKLCQLGEKPQKLYGQIAWSLRRYAAATRIYERANRRGESMTLRKALQEAGFPNWPKALDEAQARLKKVGRIRAAALYQHLLEIDISLKGTHSHERRGRLALEKLFASFAAELYPRLLAS